MQLTTYQTETLVELAIIQWLYGEIRPVMVAEAHESGISKNHISRCTGIARPTIDRILERKARNMKTIYDVLHRLLSAKPLSELEVALAHEIIATHEAQNAPAADDPAETPAVPASS